MKHKYIYIEWLSPAREGPKCTVERRCIFTLNSYVPDYFRSVNADEALSIEGVHTYVGAQDIPGKNALGVIIHDEELFATKQVCNLMIHITGYTKDPLCSPY